jgi:phage N-6-adenine-methyltransferase
VTDDTKELRQCWRTKPAFFQSLHDIFNFTIDACASDDNALLPKYWTIKDDARLQDWSKERVYCNPPFGEIKTFLVKAPSAITSVFVLPITAMATRYFGACKPSYVIVPPYRLRFDPPIGLIVNTVSPSLASVLLLYGDVNAKQLDALDDQGLMRLDVH